MFARLLDADIYGNDIDLGGLMVGLRFTLNWLTGLYIGIRTGFIGGSMGWECGGYPTWWHCEKGVRIVPLEAELGWSGAYGKKVKFTINLGAGYRGLFEMRHLLTDAQQFFLNGSIGVAWGIKHK